MREKEARRTLLLVAGASLLAMSSWFSGTVVLPELTRLWQADLAVTSWLTMAVQLGFVVGGLTSALLNLPDHFSATRVFVISCAAAGVANGLFALVASADIGAALVLRFLTGAFLAGVYPPAMKILASWYRDGRGTALGILIGALTIGKALPHAIHAVEGLPWRGVVLTSSVLALIGSTVVALGVHEGPYRAAQPPVDVHQVYAVLRNRRLRLANLGYFGHMWELYSMWGWIGVLLAASAGGQSSLVAVAAFFSIAIGAVGCVWGGRASDAGETNSEGARVARRSWVTIVAMAASASCCILAALAFPYFWLLVAVCLVWGIAVIADSAQFSTIVSEVADRRYVGTALTMQTTLGFLLTVVSLRVVGGIGETYGWSWAAVSMAPGPLLGAWAMWRLKRMPNEE